MLQVGMILSYVTDKIIKFVQRKEQESLTENIIKVEGHLLSMLSYINHAFI